MGVKEVVTGTTTAIGKGVKGTVKGIVNFRPVSKNEEGQTLILGSTPWELATNYAYIFTLYIIVALFFVSLLAIAETIRGNAGSFRRPGDAFYMPDE